MNKNIRENYEHTDVRVPEACKLAIWRTTLDVRTQIIHKGAVACGNVVWGWQPNTLLRRISDLGKLCDVFITDESRPLKWVRVNESQEKNNFKS